MNPVKSWFKRLLSQDRRSAARHEDPSQVAYYWDGATPLSHPIRDISSSGLYLYTNDRWYPGTLVMMTLQCPAKGSPPRSIAVQSRVVRSGTDGVGFQFVLAESRNQSGGEEGQAGGADKKALEEFLQGYQKDQGQAIVEYVLHLPGLEPE